MPVQRSRLRMPEKQPELGWAELGIVKNVRRMRRIGLVDRENVERIVIGGFRLIVVEFTP